MNMFPRTIVGSLALSFALAAFPAAAKELAGAKMPDTLTVAGKTLKLNGMGLRKKAVFKVYVGGLYLEAPNANAAAILAADAPKALTMHFLRSIEKQKLVDAYKEGFEANAPQKAAAQKANIEKFYSTVTDVKEGSVTTYSYAPGAGTVVHRDGKDVATIEGKEFAEVLFSLSARAEAPVGGSPEGSSGQLRLRREDSGGAGTLPPRI